MMITCPFCRTENPDYANFCQECGNKINSLEYQEIKNEEDNSKDESIDFTYIIFLERADGHREGTAFPRYFKYEYDTNPNILLEKALKNNHLSKSKPLYNIEKAKVSEIKEILKKYNLKVSGRKNELIDRIKINLTEKEIKDNFPGSYYVLTDEGRKIVKKNEHVIYYHKSKYLGIISLKRYNDLLKEKNDAPNLKYEIALELLDEYALKERKNGNWGLYTNSFLAKAKIYEDKNEYEHALNDYLKICILDLSGLNNGNVYTPGSIMLAPGIIEFIERINSKLKLDTNAMKIRYFKCFEELNLPKTKLSKDQSFKRLIKSI
jgi:thiol-disulfide isomerase/thioredoxin